MTEHQAATFYLALKNFKEYLEGLIPISILPGMPGPGQNGEEPQ